MIGPLDLHQALFFLILIVAFALLLTERLRNDMVAVLIIIALTATGLLSSTEALAGFGSEPAIAVVAIFVLNGALHQTGLMDIDFRDRYGDVSVVGLWRTRGWLNG